MKRSLFLIFLSVGLFACSTQGPVYNPKELATENYQKNVDNAVDAADVLKDFDQSKIPQANLEPADLSNLVQADLYFNQGDYAKASPLYDQLARKYKDPRIIYKAIICLEHVSSTPKRTEDLQFMVQLFIQVDPNSKLAKLFQMKNALNANNVEYAEQNLKFLLDNNQDNIRVILLFVSSMLSNDVTPAAHDSLVKFADYTIENYSRYPEASLVAAVAYSIADDQAKLAERLDYIRQSYPNWQIPVYWSSGILSHYGNNETLVNILEPILNSETVPDQMLQNIYIAALLNLHQVEKAQTYLTLQLTTPSRNNALVSLGIIAAKAKNYPQAVNYLNEVQTKDSNLNSIIALVTASIYDQMNLSESAIIYYNKVAKTNPYLQSVANIMLLNDYFNTNNYTELNKLLGQMALNAHLNEMQTLLFKASYYVGVGKFEEAYAILAPKYNTYQNNKDYLYQYASMSALTHKTSQAISLYKKYIKLFPKEAFGYNDLAYIYANDTHEYKLAKKYADKAYSIAPLDANVLDTLGWIYYKMGNYNQAYTYIKNGYDTVYTPDAATHLKAVYLAMHKPELANQVVIVNKAQVQAQLKQQLVEKALALLMYLQFGVEIK